ncbi:cation/multidrug efflux pump [Sessilibacter sp. MAH2]
MFYTLLTIILVGLALFVAFLSLRYLFKTSWLMGWIKGTIGLTALGLAIVIALVGLDFFSYKQVIAEKSVGTLEFRQLESQKFQARLLTTEGQEMNFDINGDQWQLDAKIIKWPGFLAALGVKPAFKLERISGRYYSWEQEQTEPRSVYPIYESNYTIDVWQWCKRLSLNAIGVDATYGSATYLPMADGALYEVSLSHTGLVARPFNNAAENAINSWN